VGGAGVASRTADARSAPARPDRVSTRRPVPSRIPITIGLRLTAWYGACLTASLLLLLALAYPLVSASLAQADREAISDEARELSGIYRSGGAERVIAFLHGEDDPEPFLIHLTIPAGEPRVLQAPHAHERVDAVRLARLPSSTEGTWGVFDTRDGARVELLSLTLPDGGVLRVGKTTEARTALLRRLRTTALTALVPTIAVTAAGAWLLAFWALRPVRHIINTVRRIEVGAIDARVPTRGTGDEMDELGTLFNRMLDRIAALIRGMRHALDDAAHELRTPMTRLRGTAEIALRSGADLEGCREALADCVEESDRLLTLVDTLMDISEAETGALRLTRESIAIHRLLDDTLDLYRDVAEAQGVSIVAASADLHVPGDRNRLRQALANLVDNAIKYTPAGGRVALSALAVRQGVEIAVHDTGIGIAADELPRIWSRLYRGDRARTRPGLGLGLSLVRAIVHAHGGRIDVVSTPGGGSTFTVLLPATPAPAAPTPRDPADLTTL